MLNVGMYLNFPCIYPFDELLTPKKIEMCVFVYYILNAVMCVCCSIMILCVFLQLLSAVFLVYNRIRGLRTSGIAFFFWTLLLICGVFQYRTEIINAVDDVSFALHSCFYCVILNEALISVCCLFSVKNIGTIPVCQLHDLLSIGTCYVHTYVLR